MSVFSSNPGPKDVTAPGTHSESNTSQAVPPTATQLLTVWRDTLSAPDATIDENFFDAGGTSLLAARLSARIKTQLGCAVTAADILSHPSVRQLARKLAGADPVLDRGASDRRAAMQRRAFTATRPNR